MTDRRPRTGGSGPAAEAGSGSTGRGHAVSNGVVATLFAVTGPLAILLNVAIDADLSAALIDSWILISYVVGGVLSVLFSVVYRQPLALAWTIPGVVLLGPALRNLSFEEVVGAYLVTGVVLVVLGVTGWARRAMAVIPMPIIMGMVAGIFLPFVIAVVTSFVVTPLLVAAMAVTFFAVTAVPRLVTVVPPVLAALIVGVVVVLLGPEPGLDEVPIAIGTLVFVAPAWSWPAMLELVVPLTLTVVAMQNTQGFAILRANRFEPPEDRLTVACGGGTILSGVFGAVPICVTGPTTGILNTSGPRERRWVGGVVFGILFALFGVFSPTATALALALPATFIVVLGGLALVPVLADALAGAFRDRLAPISTVTALVVTASEVTLLRVGAAFWGLVAGMVIWLVIERPRARRAADGA
jgi:benzoate membrane transport protein